MNGHVKFNVRGCGRTTHKLFGNAVRPLSLPLLRQAVVSEDSLATPEQLLISVGKSNTCKAIIKTIGRPNIVESHQFRSFVQRTCFWPPESLMPLSPTSVSNFSGHSMIKSNALACRQAFSMSSCGTSLSTP